MIIDQQKLEEIARTLIDGNPDSKEDRSIEMSLPGLGELYIHYFGIEESFWHKKIRSLLLRNREKNLGISQSCIIGIKRIDNGPYDRPTNVYCAKLNVLETKNVPHYDFPELINDRALYVEPNFRGRGFGKGLVSLSLAILCEESRWYDEKYRSGRMPVCLKVHISEEDADVIHFYEQTGFKIKERWGCGWEGRYFIPPQEISPFIIKERSL